MAHLQVSAFCTGKGHQYRLVLLLLPLYAVLNGQSMDPNSFNCVMVLLLFVVGLSIPRQAHAAPILPAKTPENDVGGLHLTLTLLLCKHRARVVNIEAGCKGLRLSIQFAGFGRGSAPASSEPGLPPGPNSLTITVNPDGMHEAGTGSFLPLTTLMFGGNFGRNLQDSPSCMDSKPSRY